MIKQNTSLLPPAYTLLKGEQARGLLSPMILFSGEAYTGKRQTALALASWYLNSPETLSSPYFATIGTLPRTDDWNALSNLYSEKKISFSRIQNFFTFFLRKFQSFFWEVSEIKTKIASADLAYLQEFVNVTDEPNSREWDKISATVLKIMSLYPKGISVGQVRALKEWAFSLRGVPKFMLIEGAQTLSIGGMNALLKILEEPPADFMCVLTTNNKRGLPETLISRLRSYSFSPYSDEQTLQIIASFGGNPDFSRLGDFFGSFNTGTSSKTKNLAKDFYFSLQESNPFPANLPWDDLFKDKENSEKNLRLFLSDLLSLLQKRLYEKPAEAHFLFELTKILNTEAERAFIFHQNPLNFLQGLYYHLKQAWTFEDSFS